MLHLCARLLKTYDKDKLSIFILLQSSQSFGVTRKKLITLKKIKFGIFSQFCRSHIERGFTKSSKTVIPIRSKYSVKTSVPNGYKLTVFHILEGYARGLRARATREGYARVHAEHDHNEHNLVMNTFYAPAPSLYLLFFAI